MSDDTNSMARELEGMLNAGGLDPTALLAGEWRFHSVFLAPFTPSFAEARRRFLADGSGPLAGTAEQLCAQGLPPAEAEATARSLLESAQGLCVAILAGDHGVATAPQPFFGHLSPEWRSSASQVVGEHFQPEMARALDALIGTSTTWPRAVAGPALHGGDLRGYWLELAHGCASTIELAGSRSDARIADLGLWVVSAVQALAPDGLDAEDHAAVTRCALASGEPAVACQGIADCAAAGGEEAVVELFDVLAAATCAKGGDPAVEAWLTGPGAALAARLGCAYDAALARVRVAAAAGADPPRLRAAVDGLIAANRKLARQALTREPLWQVTAADPGELIDTAAAAELIGRSPAFVSKRLDARTIPFHVRDGQLRLPRVALTAWKEALDAHQALD